MQLVTMALYVIFFSQACTGFLDDRDFYRLIRRGVGAVLVIACLQIVAYLVLIVVKVQDAPLLILPPESFVGAMIMIFVTYTVLVWFPEFKPFGTYYYASSIELILAPQKTLFMFVILFPLTMVGFNRISLEWLLAYYGAAAMLRFDEYIHRREMEQEWRDEKKRMIWQAWSLKLRLLHTCTFAAVGFIIALTIVDQVWFHGFDVNRIVLAAVGVVVLWVLSQLSRMDHSDIDENRPD